jgi:hypothetical protein
METHRLEAILSSRNGFVRETVSLEVNGDGMISGIRQRKEIFPEDVG